MQKSFTVYPYRWVVLLVFALLNGVIQLDWITFAPITVDSMRLYGVSAFWIVLLSMSFMVVYIFVSFPASYIIDRYGIRVGVGIGALLTGVFGYIRGAYGHDYTIICVSQFALAVAQPFIMNAITKVAAEWFPINERATSTGIVVLLQFIGIIVAMALTKPLAASYLQPGQTGLTLESVQSMLTVFGIVSAVSAVLFIVFAKDKPPTPPSSDEDAARYGIFDGMKHLFKQRDMLLSLGIFFIGLGMFNAITTYIDLLLSGKGFTPGGNEAGDVGAVMMLAGILGAVVMPPISDRLRKRKLLMVVCMVCLMPGLIGLTFFRSYGALVASSAIFGFFFMAAAPIGYQYAAEVSHPAPESTSQGLIVMSGQISGTIFITAMALIGQVSMEAFADATKASQSVSLTPFMIGYIVLALLNVVLSLMLRESKLVGKPAAAA